MRLTETPARYPGDSVITLRLVRGHELGSIRVQDYGSTCRRRYKVGEFLPGREESSPGDTPKVWPEREEWADAIELAKCWLFVFAGHALLDGWRHAP